MKLFRVVYDARPTIQDSLVLCCFDCCATVCGKGTIAVPTLLVQSRQRDVTTSSQVMKDLDNDP
jgi:hypothetical protein